MVLPFPGKEPSAYWLEKSKRIAAICWRFVNHFFAMAPLPGLAERFD
jgi:hypothetical protein